jgi:hypothetical protein
MIQKKRHHYVPIAYLNSFTDAAGQLVAYPKDRLGTSFRSKPNGIGFETYYYSQVRPDGGQDNNTLEDMFSEVETPWTPLVADLEADRDITAKLQELFVFIAFLSAPTIDTSRPT